MKINAHPLESKNTEKKSNNINTFEQAKVAFEKENIKFKAIFGESLSGNKILQKTEKLNSIGYWDSNKPQDWGLDLYEAKGIEIYFLECGTMPFSHKNQTFVLNPNQLIIRIPGDCIKIGNPNIGMGKFYWIKLDVGSKNTNQNWKWPKWIVLSPSDLERIIELLKLNIKPIFKTNKAFKDCLQQISYVLNSDNGRDKTSIIRLIINNTLLLILDLLEKNENELTDLITDNYKNVELFLLDINNNLSEIWTTKKMAQTTGIGLTRFTYYCKQITNLTPMRYLTIKRLEMAKSLLIEYEKLSIAQVAYSCGFTTSQYFSTLFKRYEKCTPNQFRLNSITSSPNS